METDFKPVSVHGRRPVDTRTGAAGREDFPRRDRGVKGCHEDAGMCGRFSCGPCSPARARWPPVPLCDRQSSAAEFHA